MGERQRSLMEEWDKLERERIDAAFRMDMKRVEEIRALQRDIADRGAAQIAGILTPERPRAD